MTRVTVCICTRRRPEGLDRLLKSIDDISIPEGVELDLVIVENDENPTSRGIVEGYERSGRFTIRYFLEPNPGISFARNKSIKEARDCDFCCFVDDDQIVDKQWMSELIKCQREFNADGISGSTPPLFEFEVPTYIKTYHEEEQIPYGTIVEKAATGCLLIRKSWLDKVEGPFDLRLNFTGGEDYYMTHNVTMLGGILRSNPNAISYEIIPAERATIGYVYHRTFRIANTKLFVQSLIDHKIYVIKILPRAILRFFLGVIIFIPYWLFSRKNKHLGLFKISYSMGFFMYLFGRKNKFYKD